MRSPAAPALHMAGHEASQSQQSKVTFELHPMGDSVRLTVVHVPLAEGDPARQAWAARQQGTENRSDRTTHPQCGDLRRGLPASQAPAQRRRMGGPMIHRNPAAGEPRVERGRP